MIAFLGAIAIAIASQRPGEPEVVRPCAGKGNRPLARASAPGPTPLHKAIRANEVDVVRELLAQGANPNERDGVGNTPLIASLSPTALLDPLGPGEQQARRTAVEREHALRKRIAAMLVQSGADVNAAGDGGLTPLMAVAQWGHSAADDVGTMRDLIGRGAMVNTASDDGHTTLMIAARRGKKDVVELLLSNGAAADVKNCQGETAAALAEAGGHSGIVKLLRR